MSRFYLTMFLLVSVLLGFACFHGITFPKYIEQAQLQWGQYQPLDVDQIVKDYPQLHGRLFTAPEYMERLEKEEVLRKAKGDIEKKEAKIEAGANLQIEVVGEPELTRSAIVNIDGEFDFPYIGIVKAGGKTMRELKQELQERLSVYYVSPQIVLNLGTYGYVTTYGPSPYTAGDIVVFTPTGSVTQWYSGRETVSRVVGNVGLHPTANWRAIRVIRHEPETNKTVVIICDFYNLLQLADEKQDIPILSGDIIVIPKQHSIGDQLKRDWDTLLGYLTGAREYNELRVYFRDSFWR